MKLSKIAGLLYACREQLKPYADVLDDLATRSSRKQAKTIDRLLADIEKTRQAIHEKKVEVD